MENNTRSSLIGLNDNSSSDVDNEASNANEKESGEVI